MGIIRSLGCKGEVLIVGDFRRSRWGGGTPHPPRRRTPAAAQLQTKRRKSNGPPPANAHPPIRHIDPPAHVRLLLVNTLTARRRTAWIKGGTQAGGNCAMLSGKKLIGSATYTSQPDPGPAWRRLRSRQKMRVPGRGVVTTGSSSSEGGIPIDQDGRM